MIWHILRPTLAGVFLTAGAIKAWDPARFALDVHHYRLLPWALSAAVAFYLPWLEIVCGAALYLKKADRGALLLVLGLTSAFLAALVSAWSRGLDISCGCFGGTGSANYPLAITLDLALLIAAAALFRSLNREAKPKHVPPADAHADAAPTPPHRDRD